jgi:hypothetical protein
MRVPQTEHDVSESVKWLSLMTNHNYCLRKVKTCTVGGKVAEKNELLCCDNEVRRQQDRNHRHTVIKTQQSRKPNGVCSYYQQLSVSY